MDAAGRRAQFDFDTVLLVADLIDEGELAGPTESRRDLEMTDASTLSVLKETIEALGLAVHHLAGPDELAAVAQTFGDAVVLTLYGGQASRNRMALVPALCETFGLRFVGPDVYGRVIAQDKAISKRLALDAGLQTPPWRLLREIGDLAYGLPFDGPVVAKPVLEGSSIGIGPRNLVRPGDDLAGVVAELLTDFGQPVLVEGFIAGREVAYCRIEGGDDNAWSFSEVVIDGDPAYFESRLFDADEKTVRNPGRTVRNVDSILAAADRAALDRLLRMYGPYGYCRIDGRWTGGSFHFIELTPDAWIAPLGQFAMSFTEKGWTYAEVIAQVLASASPIPPGRRPSD